MRGTYTLLNSSQFLQTCCSCELHDMWFASATPNIGVFTQLIAVKPIVTAAYVLT